MRAFILNLGDSCADYRYLAPGVADGTQVHVPIRSILVETDDGQGVVIDTGNPRGYISGNTATRIGPGRKQDLDLKGQVLMRPEDYLLRRLADLDVGSSDVRHLINTHFHADHAGNNDLFWNATCYAQRGHLEDGRTNPRFPERYWFSEHLKYEALDGSQEILPGVTIVPTPGHVPHHQSVVLDLPNSGRIVVCGDAIFCADQLNTNAWSNHQDPVAAEQSARTLESLVADRDGFLLFGHDVAQTASLKTAPFYYD